MARHGQRLPNVFLGGRVTVPPRRRRTRPFPAPLRGVCRHRARRVPRPKRKLTSAARAATSPVMGGIYPHLVFALAMLAALSVARAEPARLPEPNFYAGRDVGTLTPIVSHRPAPGRLNPLRPTANKR